MCQGSALTKRMRLPHLSTNNPKAFEGLSLSTPSQQLLYLPPFCVPHGFVCSPWGQPFFRRAAGERRRREFCVYFHYTIFFSGLSIGKLHNLFPVTLCSLPIAFCGSLWYTIITVEGRQSPQSCRHKDEELKGCTQNFSFKRCISKSRKFFKKV